jgi:NADH:ubiquinone oxidoreductase subunit 2 (subunit N)
MRQSGGECNGLAGSSCRSTSWSIACSNCYIECSALGEIIMGLFRLFLIACLVAIIGYTAVTIANHGWDLMPVFFGDMAAMAWPGQFNFDFFCFLLLSGLWVAWRNEFRPAALALAVVAVLGGMMFLSAYLLFLSFRCNDDVRVLMLGERRARQS